MPTMWDYPVKQFILLSVMTVLGGVAALVTPFWGVMLYYTFAVLRPQHMWEWALPIEVRWSLVAAVIVLIGVGVNLNRLLSVARWNRIITLMLIFGVLLMISVLTAFDPVVAQNWGVEYGKILLIAVIASILIDQLWQVRLLAVMILLCLGYIAWEINYQYLFESHRLDIFHYGYGGLDNNGAGLMLAMGVPFACCFATGGSDRMRMLKLAGCAFIAACMIHAVMMSYSRGAMLAGLCGLVWLCMHYRPRIQALLLAAVLCVVVLHLAGEQIRERFMTTTNFAEDSSAQSRFNSWRAAWAITWEHPVFGKGIRNANMFTHNFGADYQGRTIHNQYLQIAADSGIPAALTYIAMLMGSMYLLGRSRRRCLDYLDDHPDGDEDHRAEIDRAARICLAAQSSLVIFAVDGIFLSLEMFELPWVLMVMAGVMPAIVDHRIARLTDHEPEDEPPLPHAHRPAPRPVPGRAIVPTGAVT